jgi:zinc protease
MIPRAQVTIKGQLRSKKSTVTKSAIMRIRHLSCLVWVIVLVLGPVHAILAVDQALQKIVTVEGITEYRLDNGLRVLLFPDPSKPRVTVNLTVFVGSRHEGYGEAGMAHLLEHMVFKGTPSHPNISQALQGRGAQFNGTTSPDRTNYFETLPASDDNLEFAIALEADRLVNSSIKREDLASEMTVVRNEFERGENTPRSVLNERIMAAAYTWHNYGKSTIGNRSDIERVPIANLQAFYRKYYQPDNAIVVVAGQFDEAKALGWIYKYFGPIPRPQRQLDMTYTEEPAQDGERLVTLRRVGQIGAVGAVYHIPAGPHPEFPALQVLANILSTQPSGRLYKALVETKKATSAGAFALAMHDPGVLTLRAEVPPDGALENVRDTLIASVEEMGATGVTAEEVQRARQQILKARDLAAAETSQLAVALSEWAAQGDWRLYFLHRDRMEQVTPEDVQSVAAKYLQRNNRTVGIYIPTAKPERVAIPSTPDVDTLVSNYKGRDAIAAGEAFDVNPANLEARTLWLTMPEGIKAALLPKKTRGEEVHAILTLHYGNAENLKDLEAAASFLPPLMLRGTRHLTRQQLMDELDRLKANLGAGSSQGHGGRGGGGAPAASAGSVSFSIHTTRANLPAVLDLLRQVLREPTLPAEEFELLKRERLADLEQMRTEPSALASRTLTHLLSTYPKDDVRYIPTLEEEIERVQAATLDQVRTLHGEYLGSGHGTLAIIGDFDTDECTEVLKKAITGWTAAKPYARIARPVTAQPPGTQQRINTPDKANATYTAGLILPLKDDDPDYPALVMANFILGGSALSSRLGDRIRQQEGLSYGVSSSFSAAALDQRANFTVTAISNPQNIAKVAQAAYEEMERLSRDGVSGAELARAKAGYLQYLKVMRTNGATLAGMLNNLLFNNRTFTYYSELENKIESLTPEQVSEAFRQHIDLQKLVIISAGDFAKTTAGGD